MPNYFCYERNFAMKWVPVVFHGEKPVKSVNGQDIERTPLTEIGNEYIDSDGSPMFGALMEKIKAPND